MTPVCLAVFEFVVAALTSVLWVRSERRRVRAEARLAELERLSFPQSPSEYRQ